MPTLTRWYIKTALAWLLTALAIGVALQAGIVSPGARARVWPAYLHLITIGWLTGLIFGVAWWLFPRPAKSSADRTPADRTPYGWASYFLLNAGLLLRATAEPLAGSFWSGPLRAVVLVSAVAQFAGVATFAAVIWPRVRSR